MPSKKFLNGKVALESRAVVIIDENDKVTHQIPKIFNKPDYESALTAL